jgi:hypothetical protein
MNSEVNKQSLVDQWVNLSVIEINAKRRADRVLQ